MENKMHKEFNVHMLNDKGKEKAKEIAESFDELLNKLERVLFHTPSREFSIICTKLEEACFFAKKAMANNPDNCVEKNE